MFSFTSSLKNKTMHFVIAGIIKYLLKKKRLNLSLAFRSILKSFSCPSKAHALPEATELQTIRSVPMKPQQKSEIPDRLETLPRITTSLPIKTKQKNSCVISKGLCLDSSIQQVPKILISSRMTTCNAKNLCPEAQVLYLVVVYCIAEYTVLQKGQVLFH